MAKSTRGRFTLEFKQEAVRLVGSGRSQARASRGLAANVAAVENVPRGTFVSIATDVLAICEEFRGQSLTVPQFHKFQELWNCGIAGSILLELAAQFHSFTRSQKLRFCGTVYLAREVLMSGQVEL
jgi:hypothetical protein